MRVSEITPGELAKYAREDETDTEILSTFSLILSAVKSFIKGYTGLSDEQLDTKEDISIAVFVLSNEMYENRIFTVKDNNVNKVVQTILDMHSINLL
ncbi:head-tail connector protein [Lysinibacillus sp. IITD104]|uniref:head-tail connector protein n=1 Tax=Lysinibacillus sp. IITD104 TaxID=3116650 RepID=UPI002FD6B612